METKYFIDYIYNQTSGENFYHQLVRTKDDAILFSNRDLETVIRYAKFELGIDSKELIIL